MKLVSVKNKQFRTDLKSGSAKLQPTKRDMLFFLSFDILGSEKNGTCNLHIFLQKNNAPSHNILGRISNSTQDKQTTVPCLIFSLQHGKERIGNLHQPLFLPDEYRVLRISCRFLFIDLPLIL